VRLRATLTALAAVAAFALTGCGGNDAADTAGATDTPASSAPSTDGTESPTPEESAVPAEVPTVDVPPGAPPTELQITEVTEGTGEVAEPGDHVFVDYVGVLYESPDQPFDQSYSRGQPIDFTVGGGVIEGFSEGVTGMRVGGRRQVVIPPDKGYGAQGAGGVIPPNATLVFVMDLREVQKAAG
jgi:peptidylprolyl isomerase